MHYTAPYIFFIEETYGNSIAISGVLNKNRPLVSSYAWEVNSVGDVLESLRISVELIIVRQQHLEYPCLVECALVTVICARGRGGETKVGYACSVIHPVGDWVESLVWVLCPGYLGGRWGGR